VSTARPAREHLAHSGGSESIRRSPAYLDWVERIWGELHDYLET
jgi:hypothetical protein